MDPPCRHANFCISNFRTLSVYLKSHKFNTLSCQTRYDMIIALRYIAHFDKLNWEFTFSVSVNIPDILRLRVFSVNVINFGMWVTVPN